jgi:multiple sugar transport system ATP-binding protein
MAGLRISNLNKEFLAGRSNVRALDALSLEINSSELLVVLGPSGCGKTTLLRCIAGLETPTSGEIMLGSETITRKKPEDRRIGMAFQYPALLPQLTVSENISLGPKLRGVTSAERSQRTTELAELLEITDLLGRSPETLSGGQQQRVSLARALATRPELLLLDEPLANLDPISRVQLRDAIRRVQQRLGVTTVYVTHDQTEAAAVGDRIAIITNGRFQGIGPARELYTDPPNLFVAQFFGPETPNVVSGTFEPDGFHPAGTNIVFRTSVRHSGAATCVLRARSIRPGTDFTARIESVQHTGWSTSLLLSIQSVQLRAEFPPSANLRVGDSLNFMIGPADFLFFDSAGARLHRNRFLLRVSGVPLAIP